LGKPGGPRRIGGRTSSIVCACGILIGIALGLLGGGALSAHAQVSVPQLPQTPNLPAPAPSLSAPPPVPALPQVEVPPPPPAPEPVQRALPTVGEATGGSSGGSSSGDPVSGAVDVVRGGVEGVLGGAGSGAGGTVRRAGDALGSGAPAGSGAGAAGSSSVAGAAGAGLAAGTGAAGRGGATAGFSRSARARRAGQPRRALRDRSSRRRFLERRLERRRARVVRRLRGCLDALPPMQRTTLILRYGVGPLRARSPREAARLLDVSGRRVRLLERRGVRALARTGDGSGCAGTGISRATLIDAYELVAGTSMAGAERLPAPLEASVRLATSATVALDEGDRAAGGWGAVAGARESRGEKESASPEPNEGESVSPAGPSFGDPFGTGDSAFDDPRLLLLLLIVVACLISAGREIRRALR
jgi:hypothetical protein